MGGITRYIAKIIMVNFKQVLPIAVAMMIYLLTSNTLRGIYFLLTVKHVRDLPPSFPRYHGYRHRLIVK